MHVNDGRNNRIAVRDEERILQHFHDDPTQSTRGASHRLRISHSTIYRTLRRDSQHPYHYTRVQKLYAGDFEVRFDFCVDLLAQIQDDPDFHRKILWTDECCFTPNGIFNYKNYHYWAQQNPHVTRTRSFQYRYSINVWAGIIGSNLVSATSY